MNTSKSSNPGSNTVSGSDLIDAKLEEHQVCASKLCPGCGHKLEGKPVSVRETYLLVLHMDVYPESNIK